MMLFVSTRKNLTNENHIGPTSYWDVSMNDQMEEASEKIPLFEDVVERLRGKTILILIHGYNNEYEDVVRAYQTIEQMVESHADGWYDEVIGFTWPGGENPLDWYGPKRRAGTVAPRLSSFIRTISDDTQAIDVMSHSLGGRVALAAMSALPQNSVRANFLTASAVDNEVLEPMQKYNSSVKLAAEESIVFHSKHDAVLRSAYRIAEWDNPLGLFGPENPGELLNSLPEVYVANCKNVIRSHGEYKSTPEIYQFINHWLSGGIDDQFSTI